MINKTKEATIINIDTILIISHRYHEISKKNNTLNMSHQTININAGIKYTYLKMYQYVLNDDKIFLNQNITLSIIVILSHCAAWWIERIVVNKTGIYNNEYKSPKNIQIAIRNIPAGV